MNDLNSSEKNIYFRDDCSLHDSCYLQAILQKEFWIKDIQSITPIPHATYNRVYHVKTKNEEYVLTHYCSRGFARNWKNILSLLRQLRDGGSELSVPYFLCHSDGGEVYTDLNGDQYTLMYYLPGCSLTENEISPEHCRLAAEWLRQFHRQSAMLKDKDQKTAGTTLHWINDLLNSSNCRRNAYILDVNILHIQQVLAEIQSTLSKYTHLISSSKIHADFFSGNVLFSTNNNNCNNSNNSVEYVSGVIDWEFCITDFYCLDLLIGLHAWGFDSSGTWQPQRTRAWWQGVLLDALKSKNDIRRVYLSDTLSRSEQMLLWRCLGRLACYRIIIMRLHNHHFLSQDILQYQNILKYYDTDLPHLQDWFL